jgi:transaldolase
MGLIAEIIEIYSAYPNFTTEVLVASVRNPTHIIEAAKMGADVSTLPPSLLWMLYKHPLTERGLETFLKDWAATGQSIL